MFAYSSSELHSVATPEGPKIKEIIVKVENNKGTKTVIEKGPRGIHSDTIELKSNEIKNIEKRKFMPGFFRQSMKNIKAKKSNKRRKSHSTRKTGWLEKFLSA